MVSFGKRNVFRLERKEARLVVDLSLSGKEFQMVGAANEKDRLPAADLMKGTSSKF